jgi:hypothetical protein
MLHDPLLEPNMTVVAESSNTATANMEENANLICTGRYKSKCHPRDIPDVAKDMSWNTPFYESEHDIIVAFDLDSRMIHEVVLLSVRGLVLFLVVWTIIGGISLSSSDYDLAYLVIGSVIIIVLWLYGRYSVRLERTLVQKNARHVACALSGIYMDESDVQYDKGHMRRIIVKYEDIQECYVTSWAFYSRYDIVVTSKSGWQNDQRIHGYFETQKFVDVVHAMMERSSDSFVVTNTGADEAVATEFIM